MARLIVEASGTPLFGDVLMEVSVSDLDGNPVSGLKPKNFFIHHLASRNHASAAARVVKEAKEGPNGFYIVSLKGDEIHSNLPAGIYILAVSVGSGSRKGGGFTNHGQALAVADLST